MFEYINNQFKSIFSCDIKFDVNDYQLGEDEEFRSNFAIIRWFKKKNTCPNVTERKGRDYLEKNKIQITNKNNINFCIYLVELYNNSVDLLDVISNNKKLEYIQEKENFNFIKDIRKVEQESFYEYNIKYNQNNIINDNIINDNIINNFSSINIEDSIISKTINKSLIEEKDINLPKNYKKNNEFIIELETEKEHPKLNVIVHVIGNYYVFKIKINGEEITLEKCISEIQLEKEKKKKC